MASDPALTGKDWSGGFARSVLTSVLIGKGPAGEFKLTHTVRISPTALAKPPVGAIVLFDGTSVKEWNKGAKIVEDKLLWRGVTSEKALGTGKLHVEFRLPYMCKHFGQARGNSGVYVQDHEIQILDSFGLEGKADECGAFYGVTKPAVNMCYPPLPQAFSTTELKL